MDMLRGDTLRFSNKIFYKLCDVDNKVAMKNKLQKCIELCVPVLIKVPCNFNIWAVDPQLDKLTKEDVILSENSIYNQVRLKHHLIGNDNFNRFSLPKLHTKYLLASESVNNVEFLHLSNIAIKKLIVSEEVTVSKFQGVVMNDGEGSCLTNSRSLSRYQYWLDSFDECNTDRQVRELLNKIKYTCKNLNFILCENTLDNNGDIQFPLGNEEKIIVNVFDCYIREKDVSQLIFDEADYKKSHYHLEPEYHTSRALLELSKAGYDLFVKNVLVVTGGSSGYLRRNCKSLNKKKNLCEGGAFWVNSAPGGKLKGKGCQFYLLKQIFEKYWSSPKSLTKKEVKDLSGKIIISLQKESEANADYIKAAEFIIRPDKYK